MTFLELCVKTRQECGIQGQGPSSVTSQTGLLKRVVDWVRDADTLIQTMYSDWDFLSKDFTANTVLGADQITKPSDFGMWDRESFAVDRGTIEGRKLRVMDYKVWRKDHSEKFNDEPYAITITPDNNLRLAQPADGTYAISANYWKNVVQLSANTDVPPYPDRFHRIIIARAKMWFFEDQEGWDNFKLAEVEYLRWLNELEGFALPGQQARSQAQPGTDQMTVVPL